MASVTINGFLDREHAKAWMSWYIDGGEQAANDHMEIKGLPEATSRTWDMEAENMEIELEPTK
jgi:uncharacterized protein YdgA (DUF945 family)